MPHTAGTLRCPVDRDSYFCRPIYTHLAKSITRSQFPLIEAYTSFDSERAIKVSGSSTRDAACASAFQLPNCQKHGTRTPEKAPLPALASEMFPNASVGDAGCPTCDLASSSYGPLQPSRWCIITQPRKDCSNSERLAAMISSGRYESGSADGFVRPR